MTSFDEIRILIHFWILSFVNGRFKGTKSGRAVTANMEISHCWFGLVNYTWFAIMVHKSGAFRIGRKLSFLSPHHEGFLALGWSRMELLVFKIHHRQKKACSLRFFLSLSWFRRSVSQKQKVNGNFFKVAPIQKFLFVGNVFSVFDSIFNLSRWCCLKVGWNVCFNHAASHRFRQEHLKLN